MNTTHWKLALLVSALCALTVESLAGAESPGATPAIAPKIKRTEIILAENWTVTCVTADRPGAKRSCSADLKIMQVNPATNVPRTIFTWLLGKESGKLTSVIIVPTGVLIAPGVAMKAGDRRARTLPFTLCQPDHCEASLDIDEALAKALSSEESADFSVTGVNGAVAKFSANLKGFDEAWALLGK